MHIWMFCAVIGIGAASFLPQLPPVYLALLLLSSAVAGLFIGKTNRRLTLVLAGFCCGFAYAVLHGHLLASSLLPQPLEQQTIGVDGHVVGLPHTAMSHGRPVQRFTFAVERSDVPQLSVQRIELSWYEAVQIHSGQHWRLLVKLKRPRGFANPGGYDYQLVLHQRRIDARGYVKAGELIEQQPDVWDRVHGLRAHLHAQLQSLDDKLRNARFMSALSIGAKKALTPADWDLLRLTGTTHLFVVSGLHISLVAGLFYAAALYFCKALLFPLAWWPAQRYAAVAACCGAVTYALLAGFSLPTQRACLMLLVVMLGLILNRPARVGGIFAMALFAVLVWDPLALRSTSFWLSFTAVAALLLGFTGRLARPGVIYTSLRTQWLVFIVLTPLLLWWFQQASLLMPLANLFAVPLVSLVIVPLVLLSALLLLLGVTPPSALLTFVDAVFDTLWAALHALQSQVGGVAQLQLAPGYLYLFAALLGANLLLLPRGFPLRVLAPLFFLPVLWGRVAGQQQAVELTILDVGQGLAVVLQVDDKVLVYDAGPRFSENFDAGSAIVASFLRHKGIDRIDQLLISHADNDHAGGLAGLSENVPVDKLMVGEPLPDTAFDAKPCRAGDSWQWGVIRMQVLHPDAAMHASSNNNSCVLHIKTPYSATLITGDIEAAVEHSLLQRYARDLRADILIVPHHGSKTSSTAKFIAAVQPRYAVVSSGYLNRFGHPHEDVVKRYEEEGVQLLNTALTGSISFILPATRGQHVAAPQAYREQAHKYWYAW
ncbi:MAG: DNA internalization-related competence protein ComEC/Rec2 [Pseudomonadales bacterium]